jgi:hypothetical protein
VRDGTAGLASVVAPAAGLLMWLLYHASGRGRESDGGKPMTESEPPKAPSYLARMVVFREDEGTVYQLNARVIVKWFFHLVRNAMIAGVLKYLADKSDSWTLKIVSDCAFFALLLYCLSYIQTWHVNVFHPWRPAKWARILDGVISAAVFGGTWYLIGHSVPNAIEEIAKAQMK